MTRVALDAVGGDFAPAAPIAGALMALAELDSTHSVQLLGPERVVASALEELLGGEYAHLHAQCDRVSVIDAPDVIGMSERPTTALRGKPRNSMSIGLRRVADGAADAFVSAGNTGAQMAASALLLRLHPGVTRPAIATLFPTAARPVVVLDSGANVDCSARELLQFARLGAVYAESVLGREQPAVGLLSIGEEAEKGNAVVKEANALFATAEFRFVGNVEGRDLPAGRTERDLLDVVVCDGFVGNVLLKFYEAVVPMLFGMLRRAGAVDGDELARGFAELDATEHGGAPLLGVRGVSIISHGRSSPRALKNAVHVAVRAVESRMDDLIGERLARDAEAPGGGGGSAEASGEPTPAETPA